MKRFSLLSIALASFAVACADSTAPDRSLTAPRNPSLGAGTGNSPPPPVDAFIEGDAGGVPFSADGNYFSNEESVSAGIALGTITLAQAEDKSHAWLQLNDDPNNPLVDVSANAKIKKQGDRLSGNGTFTVTQGVNLFVIRIETVEAFNSNPECGTTRFCGTVAFTASISTNGGPFIGDQPGTMRIYNDEFPDECGPECID